MTDNEEWKGPRKTEKERKTRGLEDGDRGEAEIEGVEEGEVKEGETKLGRTLYPPNTYTRLPISKVE